MKGILFLDFDGVINPYMYQSEVRPVHKKWLYVMQHPAFLHISRFTIGQVKNNFDQKACSYVKALCEQFDLGIVVTSSWKEFYTLKQIKALLSLHGLGKYIVGCTGKEHFDRKDKIEEYIQNHNIKIYLILDDLDLDFPNHNIKTTNLFSKEQYKQAIELLEKQYE